MQVNVTMKRLSPGKCHVAGEALYLPQGKSFTAEVAEAMKAHNTRKPEPCYNENWNKQYKTGTMRGRYLVMAALSSKHGICCGSMKHRRVTGEVVAHHVLYNQGHYSWAFAAEVTA